MAIYVGVTRAKATLHRLLALVEAGEEVVITRRGKPVVTLTKYEGGRPRLASAA